MLAAFSRRNTQAVIGLFQHFDVELLHLHERLRDTLRCGRVGALQHLDERGRHDLPGQSELVLQPAARTFLAAIGSQLAPIVVDLVLRLAHDLERDRLAELELRAAVEAKEFLPFEFELNRHHGARLPAKAFLAIAGGAKDARVLEDRHVEIGGRLGFLVEPQARHDLLRLQSHDGLLLAVQQA